MDAILSIRNLNKIYSGGFQALKDINLEVKKGEIFALLGPNGAGKTTLIGCVCGNVNPSSGSITVSGFDTVRDFRQTRKLVGLVPQELMIEMFESPMETVKFSRGLFGFPPNKEYCGDILKKLHLWDKRNSMIMTLSGGMKRRMLIAKALVHEPQLLFLDEPTAGVDVELRKNMWKQVKELQSLGVTIILTTHYIEEAEEMADRIGVIRNGEIVVVDNKKDLMKRFGRKQVSIELNAPLDAIPQVLAKWNLTISTDKMTLSYSYDSLKEDNGIALLFAELCAQGITYKDLHTKQSSLEDIFIELVG